jgi:hypothetical protein
MAADKRLPFDPPSEEAILLAIMRGSEQRGQKAPEWRDFQSVQDIAFELSLPNRGRGTRWIYRKLELMEAKGLVFGELSPWGRIWYKLTASGKAVVARLHTDDQLPPLPPSWEHQRWEERRAEARAELPSLERDVRLAAERVLAAIADPGFRAIREATQALDECSRQLSVARFVLDEGCWPDPDLGPPWARRVYPELDADRLYREGIRE